MQEPKCEAERRLGLEWINIAERGVKSHLGKRVDDNFSLMLFDRFKMNDTLVTLWHMPSHEAVTSITLPFLSSMLWDWDANALAVETAFVELQAQIQRPEVETEINEAVGPRM